MKNNSYYDIRTRNEDGSKDYLIMMIVHEDDVEAIVASNQERAEDGFIVYKTLRED